MEEIHDIADTLDRMFRTHLREDGTEHSHREVARFISDYTGAKHSSTYVGWLRTGKATNPRRSVIIALARFFDEEPAEFLTSGERSAGTREAAAQRDMNLPALWLRLSHLDPEDRRYVLDTIAMLERRQER